MTRDNWDVLHVGFLVVTAIVTAPLWGPFWLVGWVALKLVDLPRWRKRGGHP